MNAVPSSLAQVLARGDVWQGNALAGMPIPTVASGYAELDSELPGGGWPCGNLTEFLLERGGCGEVSLLLPALARLSAAGGWLALVAPPWLPHAPAWAYAGLAPERLVVVQAEREAAWCCEQLVASGGFAGVLFWPAAGIDSRAIRRLQVAAEGKPTLVCLWRPVTAASSPSPAPLRIVLTAGTAGLGVRIIKRRGRPAAPLLHLPISRPGRSPRALAGAPLSPAAPRSATLAPVA